MQGFIHEHEVLALLHILFQLNICVRVILTLVLEYCAEWLVVARYCIRFDDIGVVDFTWMLLAHVIFQIIFESDKQLPFEDPLHGDHVPRGANRESFRHVLNQLLYFLHFTHLVFALTSLLFAIFYFFFSTFFVCLFFNCFLIYVIHVVCFLCFK